MEELRISGFPCHPFFIWEFSSGADAIRFIRSQPDRILETLENWTCNEAVFRSPDAKPIRMHKELIEEMQPSSPALFYAHVALPPAVVRATLDLIDRPRKAGISRASDGLQVVMSSLLQECNPGHTMSEATAWVRADFWHPEDLLEFNREAKQRMSEGKLLQFRWRSFDPSLGMGDRSPGNWLRFTTNYRLIKGEDGVYYQLCENVAMEAIEPPVISV